MARITVAEWQRGVVFTDGALTGAMGPGRHPKRRRTVWHLIDVRPRLLQVPPQEVLTKDGVQVRVSLVATLEITDAAAWVITSASPSESIYAALQVALRDRVAGVELTELAQARPTLLEGVEAQLAAEFAKLGVTVTGVAIKDLTYPQEVRAAVAEAALAKQRGLGDLERARTEAATLRSLANTAKLMAENPMLLQLRTLQAASEGAQIIIHRGIEGSEEN